MENQTEQLQQILSRNKRVETDKAWETSLTRRLFIATVTYGVATLFLWNIGTPDPWINACVPTGGYLLSTLSLPWVKALWLARRAEASS